MPRVFGCALFVLVRLCDTAWAADIQVFSDIGGFKQAAGDLATASFNAFPIGFLPFETVKFYGLTVTLTKSGSLPIFGPGPFGFTTNILSSGVKDGDNNVLLLFVPSTRAAGMKLASVLPVTVTGVSGSGDSTTVTFSASQVSFLGFASPSGITSIRISAQGGSQSTPIVNIGDILYGFTPPAADFSIPMLSTEGLLLMTVILLFVGWRSLRRRRG
jgi:hypothetical protein